MPFPGQRWRTRKTKKTKNIERRGKSKNESMYITFTANTTCLSVPGLIWVFHYFSDISRFDSGSAVPDGLAFSLFFLK
jgi:hypothetical protein